MATTLVWLPEHGRRRCEKDMCWLLPPLRGQRYRGGIAAPVPRNFQWNRRLCQYGQKTRRRRESAPSELVRRRDWRADHLSVRG